MPCQLKCCIAVSLKINLFIQHYFFLNIHRYGMRICIFQKPDCNEKNPSIDDINHERKMHAFYFFHRAREELANIREWHIRTYDRVSTFHAYQLPANISSAVITNTRCDCCINELCACMRACTHNQSLDKRQKSSAQSKAKWENIFMATKCDRVFLAFINRSCCCCTK